MTTAHSTAWTPKMDRPMRRNRAVVVFLTSGAKFFQPEMPTASRTRRRRRAARVQG